MEIDPIPSSREVCWLATGRPKKPTRQQPNRPGPGNAGLDCFGRALSSRASARAIAYRCLLACCPGRSAFPQSSCASFCCPGRAFRSARGFELHSLNWGAIISIGRLWVRLGSDLTIPTLSTLGALLRSFRVARLKPEERPHLKGGCGARIKQRAALGAPAWGKALLFWWRRRPGSPLWAWPPLIPPVSPLHTHTHTWVWCHSPADSDLSSRLNFSIHPMHPTTAPKPTPPHPKPPPTTMTDLLGSNEPKKLELLRVSNGLLSTELVGVNDDDMR